MYNKLVRAYKYTTKNLENQPNTDFLIYPYNFPTVLTAYYLFTGPL